MSNEKAEAQTARIRADARRAAARTGLVYLSAFGSLAVQVDGLIGCARHPAGRRADGSRPGKVLAPSPTRFWCLPTLLWLDASDRSAALLCWGGVVLAAAVVLGRPARPSFCLLWLFYLSLAVAGQEFLGYQWDSLLARGRAAGDPACPLEAWLSMARDEPWPFAIWLVRWLVFRLMFLSGVVKLASGDPVWWAWQALEHHYQTQPLPTWTSWYVPPASRRFPQAVGGFRVLRRARRPVPRASGPGRSGWPGSPAWCSSRP